MSSILYTLGDNLYVNLTNQCPCNCVFCLRGSYNGLGSADNLWLEEEPTPRQVLTELKNYDLYQYGEIVFCGYGEPFCALDTLLEVSRALRIQSGIKIRINTNGLGDLIQAKATAPLLDGLIDALSISLNAPDAQTYLKLCRPKFGLEAYDAILVFAEACKKYVPQITFTVVENTIPPDEIKVCEQIAQSAGIPLRVRSFN